jgi:hypothetical protein
VTSSIPDEVFTTTGVWAQPREDGAPSQRTPRSEDEALEKALLDWVYLGLQTGSSVHLDELHYEPLNLAKLVELGKKFRRSVFETFLPTVLERYLPGQTVVQSA